MKRILVTGGAGFIPSNCIPHLLAETPYEVVSRVDVIVDAAAESHVEAVGAPASLKQHVEERPGQVDRHIGSTAKAERLLGWPARTSFEESLASTVDWYLQNEAWWRGVLARDRGVYSS